MAPLRPQQSPLYQIISSQAKEKEGNDPEIHLRNQIRR